MPQSTTTIDCTSIDCTAMRSSTMRSNTNTTTDAVAITSESIIQRQMRTRSRSRSSSAESLESMEMTLATAPASSMHTPQTPTTPRTTMPATSAKIALLQSSFSNILSPSSPRRSSRRPAEDHAAALHVSIQDRSHVSALLHPTPSGPRKLLRMPSTTPKRRSDNSDISRYSLLVGRDAELQTMRGSFRKIIKGGSSLVIVRGKAGTGKTTFVHTAHKHGVFHLHGITAEFVCATCIAKAEPYSGLVDAISSLMRRLYERDRCVDKLRTFLRSVKEDVTILRAFLPILFELADYDNDNDNDDENCDASCAGGAGTSTGPTQGCKPPTRTELDEERFSSINHSISFERLKLATLKVLAFACEPTKPVVIYLDDAQCMDQPSVDLIKAVVNSATTSFANSPQRHKRDFISVNGLLLVMSFRDPASVDSIAPTDHPFAEVAERLESATLEMTNLREDDVNQLFSGLVQKTPSHTLAISKVIHAKTVGNPFDISIYLQLLQEQRFVYFDSVHDATWKWLSPQEIDAATPIVSDELADQMRKTTFRNVSLETQAVVLVASCLGSEVPSFVLREFFADAQIIDELQLPALQLDEALSNAIGAGILRHPAIGDQSEPRRQRSQYYTWSHDKFRTTAYDCILPAIDRCQLHMRLGMLMWLISTQHGDTEWLIYLAASQMNAVRSPSACPHTNALVPKNFLGQLNLRAANLSISKSAFYPATELLRVGISKTEGPGSWKDPAQAGLLLELYSTLAETEHYLGHYEKSQAAINVVMRHARTRDDTYRAELLKAQAAATGHKRDFIQSQECYVTMLAKYRIKLQRQPGRLSRFFAQRKVQKLCQGKTWKDVTSVSTMMSDTLAWKTCKLLSNLIFACMPGMNWKLAHLCCSHILALTFRHGLSEFTVMAVMFPAIRLRAKKVSAEAKQRIGLAIDISKQLKTTPDLCRIIALIHGALFHWHHSFHESLDPLSRGYSVLLSIGDTEKAFITAMVYCFSYMNLGLCLAPLESDAGNYHKASVQFSLPMSMQVLFSMFRQAISNLQGESFNMTQHPAALNGDMMKEREVLDAMKGSSQHRSTLRDICAFRLMLASVFNDRKAMEFNLDESLDIPFHEPMISRVHFRSTFTAIACLLLAHDSSYNLSLIKRRRYLQTGRKIVQTFQDSVKDGSVNGFSVLILLKAIDGRTESLYQKAIIAAGRSGLLHLEAIANEQLAILLMTSSSASTAYETDAEHEAAIERYKQRALRLYADWGAHGKVAQLRSSDRTLGMESTHRAQKARALKARTRFDEGSSTAMMRKINLGVEMSTSVLEDVDATDDDEETVSRESRSVPVRGLA